MKTSDNKQQREVLFSKAFSTANCTLIVSMHGFWSEDAASRWLKLFPEQDTIA